MEYAAYDIAAAGYLAWILRSRLQAKPAPSLNP
jgi:hypothetical protein